MTLKKVNVCDRCGYERPDDHMDKEGSWMRLAGHPSQPGKAATQTSLWMDFCSGCASTIRHAALNYRERTDGEANS